MSVSDVVTIVTAGSTAVVVVLAGIYGLFRFVFLAPIVTRLDTHIKLLRDHYHAPDGRVVAPIAGGANGEPAREARP